MLWYFQYVMNDSRLANAAFEVPIHDDAMECSDVDLQVLRFISGRAGCILDPQIGEKQAVYDARHANCVHSSF